MTWVEAVLLSNRVRAVGGGVASPVLNADGCTFHVEVADVGNFEEPLEWLMVVSDEGAREAGVPF